MDLKALAAALFVAFITVIMDAVFNFHYIYVLVILVITSYVLVRLISIINSESPTPVSSTAPTGKPVDLVSTLTDAAKSTGITLEMSSDEVCPVLVNEQAFTDSVLKIFQILGMKTHGETAEVRSGNQPMVHLILTVNRKAGTIQTALDDAISSFQLLLSRKGGSAWQKDVPRKTELHFLIPSQ